MIGTAEKTSLTDLVQANALGRNTCRIAVTTRRGRGLIFVEGGHVVDAIFGDLTGEDAFCALLNDDEAKATVSSGIPSPHKRIELGWQSLVASALTRRIEGSVPVPSFTGGAPRRDSAPVVVAVDDEPPPPTLFVPKPRAQTAPAPAPTVAARPAASAGAKPPAAGPAPTAFTKPAAPAISAATKPVASAAPISTTPPKPASASRVPFVVSVLVVLAAIGGGLILFARPRGAEGPAPAPIRAASAPAPRAAAAPVEADALRSAGGEAPRLLSGTPPASPDPDAAVLPTVVCRILVVEDGSVKEASIFRSRLDLARFEEAALAAVKTYRFQPGSRAGAPVPVWLNYPVTFR